MHLLAWDEEGRIVSRKHMMVIRDDDGVAGLVDFEAHELAGGRMRDIAEVSNAVGSGTWPEWLGPRIYDFTVELEPDPGQARARLAALVHKKSGHRRVRADIEAAIAERINEKRAAAKKKGDEQRARLRARGLNADEFSDPPPEPADLRDLLGGPGKPLLLDQNGKTKARVKSKRPELPVVKRGGTRAEPPR